MDMIFRWTAFRGQWFAGSIRNMPLVTGSICVCLVVVFVRVLSLFKLFLLSTPLDVYCIYRDRAVFRLEVIYRPCCYLYSMNGALLTE